MNRSMRGRRQRVTPEAAAAVRADLATCEWGARGGRYALWAELLHVSVSTIQRTVQMWAGRVPDVRRPTSNTVTSNTSEFA